MNQDKSDEELLEESLREPEAFAGLIERYERRALGLIRNLSRGHQDAEDLYQGAWARAFAARAGFRGKSRFNTWFYAICLNVVRDWKRGLATRPVMESLDEGRHAGSFWERAWGRFKGSQMRAEVLGLLDRLGAGEREMIVLRYFEDLDDAGVAQVTGIPRARVRVAIHRALKKLKRGIDEGS